MRVKIGYLVSFYEQFGLKIPATIRSEGSVLLSGHTGTGKSTLLWYLLYNLIAAASQEGIHLDFEVCDYKHDCPFLYGCHLYHYEIEQIVEAIDRFYNKFILSRGQAERDGLHCLVIDEFFSFMGYLASLAKTDKNFKEDYQRVSIELSSILAMGRSLGYTLLLVVQQANTASFSSSADRENILNRIAMGSQTDISASMIFDASDISSIDYKKPLPAGQGFLAVSGEPVQEFITPRITNAKEMKEIIRNFLDCN